MKDKRQYDEDDIKFLAAFIEFNEDKNMTISVKDLEIIMDMIERIHNA